MTVAAVDPDFAAPNVSGELMDLYTRVLDLLVAKAPMREVLEAVTTTIDRLMPGASCAVLLLDKTENVLRFGAGPGLPEEWCRFINVIPVGPDIGSCGSAAFHRRRVIVPDIRTDARWNRFRTLALQLGLRACWSTPVIGKQREVLGTFAVYHDHIHEPTEHELRLVDRCTHLAAIAIDHARLFGALSESEDRFRRAFESNAVGMALLDVDRRFIRVNSALSEMLGYGEEALLQTDFCRVVDPTESDATSAALTRLVAGEQESVQLEQNHLRRGGNPVPVTLTASVLRGADGAIVGICAYVLDMSHRQAAEHQTRRAIEAETAQRTAESASRAKSQFLSAMSHELRTPLTALLGFAELLGTLEADRQQTAIERIRESACHVVSILDDVLDIAKIEASALDMDLEAITISYLAQEVLDMVGPMAAERRVSLSLEPCNSRIMLTADSRRMRQILLNLVTNAIKYNRPGGHVRVVIKQHHRTGVVQVIDSGLGIDAAFLRRLFIPFDRLGAERSGVQGSGLGLSLSRALARAMKGDLTLVSDVNVGTTAEITLPLARRTAAGQRQSGPPESDVLAARRDVSGIVLHVEDDPACGELIAEALRRRPAIHLVTCSTGVEGLITARKLQPDLILLDLDLPDMTGEQFVAELGHPEFTPPPPIVILSGRAATAPISLPSLRKPVAMAQLLQHIDERLMAGQGASQVG